MLKYAFSIVFVFSILLTGCGGGSSSPGTNNSNDESSSTLKIYPAFQTGKIIYETHQIGDFGALGNYEVIGTKRFVIKDWGNTTIEELEEENTVNSIHPSTGVVTTTTEQEHELIKWVTPKKYDVNFKKEHITVLDFSVIYGNEQAIADAIGPTVVDNTNYIGKGLVLGYVCDEYQVGAVKTCVWNNVVLKSETDLGALGFRTEVAIFATFNTAVLDSEFEIPLFTQIKAN